MLPKIAEYARNQILEPVLSAEDLGTGEGPARQMGFQRLNESPLFLGIEVALDGCRSG